CGKTANRAIKATHCAHQQPAALFQPAQMIDPQIPGGRIDLISMQLLCELARAVHHTPQSVARAKGKQRARIRKYCRCSDKCEYGVRTIRNGHHAGQYAARMAALKRTAIATWKIVVRKFRQLSCECAH